MNKKMVLILFFILFFKNLSFGRVIYISKDGSDDLSISNRSDTSGSFKTFSAALNYLAIYSDSTNITTDTIFVFSGIYTDTCPPPPQFSTWWRNFYRVFVAPYYMTTAETHSISIIGIGNVFIDGENKHAGIYFAVNPTYIKVFVTIKNITIQNCIDNNEGGTTGEMSALMMSEIMGCNLENIKIINCREGIGKSTLATSMIDFKNTSSHSYFKNMLFIDNRTGDGPSVGSGGVLNFRTKNSASLPIITIDNITIVSNQRIDSIKGIGLVINDPYSMNLTINNSIIRENQGDGINNDIYFYDTPLIYAINNCNIDTIASAVVLANCYDSIASFQGEADNNYFLNFNSPDTDSGNDTLFVGNYGFSQIDNDTITGWYNWKDELQRDSSTSPYFQVSNRKLTLGTGQDSCWFYSPVYDLKYNAELIGIDIAMDSYGSETQCVIDTDVTTDSGTYPRQILFRTWFDTFAQFDSYPNWQSYTINTREKNNILSQEFRYIQIAFQIRKQSYAQSIGVKEINIEFRKAIGSYPKITEVLFNSFLATDISEWIELQGTGNLPTNISGYCLRDVGDSAFFQFQNNSIIKPNEFVIAHLDNGLNYTDSWGIKHFFGQNFSNGDWFAANYGAVEFYDTVAKWDSTTIIDFTTWDATGGAGGIYDYTWDSVAVGANIWINDAAIDVVIDNTIERSIALSFNAASDTNHISNWKNYGVRTSSFGLSNQGAGGISSGNTTGIYFLNSLRNGQHVNIYDTNDIVYIRIEGNSQTNTETEATTVILWNKVNDDTIVVYCIEDGINTSYYLGQAYFSTQNSTSSMNVLRVAAGDSIEAYSYAEATLENGDSRTISISALPYVEPSISQQIGNEDKSAINRFRRILQNNALIRRRF